ncbi:hypothetical protein PXO_05419 [Xanthomonas oryzae pv. oryzae PXO99A]|uniref:Uncharacterized protein n=1 Tax=Xanthomonas oryzae pv. oryzae (strain PXO99A) TaxID=360094 RepID=A0A0K0GFC2_XANOP|nr:hypothetical protein PXO_05419 [Xanthomonas oryzae pv. oryzae PXO99A]
MFIDALDRPLRPRFACCLHAAGARCGPACSSTPSARR